MNPRAPIHLLRQAPRRRRSLAWLAAGLMAAALLAAGCSGGNPGGGDGQAGFRYVSATDKGQVIPAGERSPAGRVAAAQMDGAAFDLAQRRGEVVLINYWGSWCGPCVIETPELEKVYRAYQSRGVLFVGVAVKDVEDATQAFVDENDVTYPIIFDFNAKTALQLGNIPMRALPATVGIDTQGRVAGVYVGAVLAGDVEPVLDALLAEQ